MSKRFSTLEMGEEYVKCFGEPSDAGIWLIFGKEKNGKSTFALKLAKELSKKKKCLYVSAEEGTDLEFIRACQRCISWTRGESQKSSKGTHFLRLQGPEGYSSRRYLSTNL